MSERRSTEIKFRTTPSFKARVQAAAAAADKSMSEFLEECAETRMWAEQNQRLDSTEMLMDVLALYAEPDAMHPVSTSGDAEPKGWMFEARG